MLALNPVQPNLLLLVNEFSVRLRFSNSPEQARREEDTPNDGWEQSPLRYRVVIVGLQFLYIAGLDRQDVDTAQSFANNQPNEGETTDAQVHAMQVAENYWVRA